MADSVKVFFLLLKTMSIDENFVKVTINQNFVTVVLIMNLTLVQPHYAIYVQNLPSPVTG